jgi:hypothetical protein
MKSKLKIALAAGAFLLFCQLPSANAVSINVSPAGPIDFGPVPLGSTTSAVVITATGITDPNFSPAGWAVGIDFFASTDPFDFPFNPNLNNPVGNCLGGNSTCAVDVSFAPLGLGTRTASVGFTFIESNAAGQTSQFFAEVQLTGVGIEATTPLPAALPLFASGLGALGLLGWRRKRKAS